MGIENGKEKFNMKAEIERTLGNIRNVGPGKSVGYLPIETITDYCGSSAEQLINESRAKGFEAKIFIGQEWPGHQGSLFVYDRNALQELLNKNREILLQAGWPTEADTFVANLHIQVPIGTPLYKLIAQAFGDKFSENLEPDEP